MFVFQHFYRMSDIDAESMVARIITFHEFTIISEFIPQNLWKKNEERFRGKSAPVQEE